MISFEDARVLRLGFPKAHAHKATLPWFEKWWAANAESEGSLLGGDDSTGTGKPDFKIPELIRMQELYGNNIRSRVNECPAVSQHSLRCN